MEYVDLAVEYLRAGFADINNPKGLLIALIATIFLGSWRQWIPVSLVATVVHIAIGQLAPVLSGGGGEVRLPELMSEGFWTEFLVLFLGYMVIIGIFFVLKGMIFRRSAAAH